MVYILLFFLGLCLGSFINALVWRLYTNKDWLTERSECPNCHHKLKAADLVPVLSWITLRGRCRYCKKPISPQYPLVELVTGLLYGLSYYRLGARNPEEWFGLILWLALITFLMALVVYDLRYMLLPNRLVKAGAAVTILYVLVNVASGQGLSAIRTSLLGALSFGGLFHILYLASKGKWIGGGDVKLGYVLGAWLASISSSLLAIFTASLIGSLLAGVLLILNRVSMKSRLPFGPMLVTGFIIAHLYGPDIIKAYTDFILLSA